MEVLFCEIDIGREGLYNLDKEYVIWSVDGRYRFAR